MRTSTIPHDPLDAAIGQTIRHAATAALWILLALALAIRIRML